MKCLIPGRFVKLFGRAIHCLSKIGDELYIEASTDGLALRTVNSSRSAFGCFSFNESFFHEYANNVDEDDSEGQENLHRYKISMKSCLGVFKSLNTIEKNVDTCKLEYDRKETRIVLKMFCKHGIVKTHNLTFQESENLQAVFSKELCPNLIAAPAKVLIDTAVNFPNSCEEVTLSCTPESITFKNYLDDEPDPSAIVHTEMKLHPEEFDNYQIGVDTDITFCLKEARAVLAFADFVSQPVSLHFSSSGKPIVFSLDGDSLYEADFVLATLMEQTLPSQASQQREAATSTETATSTVRVSNSYRHASKMKSKTKGARGNGMSTANDIEIQNETDVSNANVTMDDEEVPNPRHIDRITTPPCITVCADHNKNRNTSDSRLNAENHGGDDDDFFSQSFPYRDMLGRNFVGDNDKDLGAYKTHESNNARLVDSQGESQRRDRSPRIIALPCVGDSEHVSNAEEKRADAAADDVLSSTPPNKRFKSIFFGTVTGPEEIRKRRKLHDTVLAADTDDES